MPAIGPAFQVEIREAIISQCTVLRQKKTPAAHSRWRQESAALADLWIAPGQLSHVSAL
jgi:hypothetical protein